MEEKKKKQIIIGGGAAGAVAMGAGAALLMPGETDAALSGELTAEVVSDPSDKSSEDIPEVLVAEVEEPTQNDNNDALLAQNTPEVQPARNASDAQPASDVQPVQDAHSTPTPHPAQHARPAQNTHPAQDAHSSQNDHSSQDAHLAQNTHPTSDIPETPAPDQNAIEPEGVSDQILAINVNPEDYMPENDNAPEIQIINTPDDMQYFVVDVNSDGMYDTILDETGMEVENVPDGAMLADADGFDSDNDIFISSEDEIQMIGHAPDEDIAVVDIEDADPIEEVALTDVENTGSTEEVAMTEIENTELSESSDFSELSDSSDLSEASDSSELSESTELSELSESSAGADAAMPDAMPLDISEQPDFADFTDMAMQVP